MTVLSTKLASAAWTQAWQLTVVALIAGLMTALACRRRPHLAYLIWMLVIVKALTPPIVASPTSVFSWALRTEQKVAPARAIAPPLQLDLTATAQPVEIQAKPVRPEPVASSAAIAPPRRISLSQGMLLAWACGTAILALYVALKWFAWRRSLRASQIETPAWLHRETATLKAQLHVRRNVRILVSHAASVPAVFGFWRPTVALPADLISAHPETEETLARSRNVIQSVLAHELIHVRRGDTLAALLQLTAQLLWWFHPLVWWANRQIRRERESACDEEVVAALECRPTEYARVLLDLLEAQTRPIPALAVPGVGMMGLTARRLQHLIHHRERFHARTPRAYYAMLLIALLAVLPGNGLQLSATQLGVAQAGSQTTDDKSKKSGEEPASAEFASLQYTADFIANQAPQGELKVRYAPDSPAAKAVARLREVGAHIYDPWEQGQDGEMSVSLVQGFKGTADDVALLGGLEGIGVLQVDLSVVDPKAFGQVHFAHPIRMLALDKVTGAALNELQGLPTCKSLQAIDAELSPAGCRKLVQLAPDIEGLVLTTPQMDGEKPAPARWITDEALAELAKFTKLKSIMLHHIAATDSGLKNFSTMANLQTLNLGSCPSVRGAGLADLAKMPNLRTLSLSEVAVDAAGLKALGTLTQLEQLILFPAKWAPADFEPVANLKHLKKLTVFDNWSSDDRIKDVSRGDAVLRVAGRLPELKFLTLTGLPSSDEGLAHLVTATFDLGDSPRLPELRSLSLHPAILSDRTLETIGNLKSLAGLSLAGKGTITDAGLAHLSGLSKLRAVALPGDELTDAGLKSLAPLAELEVLSLSNAKKLNGTGLAALADCKKLKGLALIMSGVNDAGCQTISRLESLLQVDLNDSKITDTGVALLAKMPNLQSLNLGSTEITDASLVPLAEAKQLRDLNLQATKVSNEAVAKFRKRFPRLGITHGNDWTLTGALGFTTGSFHPFYLNLEAEEAEGAEP